MNAKYNSLNTKKRLDDLRRCWRTAIYTRIWIPTIMHCGRHMLQDVIIGPHMNNYGYDLIPLHVDNQKFNAEDLEGEIVFSALRHPARVLASFDRRIGRDRDEYYNQWRIMMKEVHYHVDCYLHLDSDIRDAEVDRMSELLGIPLNRDWSVTPLSGAECNTHDLSIEQCPEAPQEFIDFYEQTIRETKTLTGYTE